MTTQEVLINNQSKTEELSKTRWKIDSVHSNVLFSVKHMGFFEVTGKFTEFDATLDQRGDGFGGAAVNASVKTASIDTGSGDRDKHLRSADFFDAEQYPLITFTSTSVERGRENGYLVNGELTIRDITRPVQFATQYFGEGTDPWGNQRVGFKATATINRYDYGLKWNQILESGALLVSKSVDISLNLQFVKEK